MLKFEFELWEFGCERYGRMFVFRKWIGFFCFIMNVVLNFIVKCDDMGDGIIELEIGDFMKFDNGDFMEFEVLEDVFLKEEDVILFF